MKCGHSIVTEAEFIGKTYRADVFDLDTREAYEVTVTSPSSPEKKAFYKVKGIILKEIK